MLKKNAKTAKTRNDFQIASRIVAGVLSLYVMVCGIAGVATKSKMSSFDLGQVQENSSFSKSEKVDDAMDVVGEIAGVDFCLSSGAGAWGASLRINADGTFTGDYHDTDMGDTGETYPSGTMYSCEFSGKFGNPQKVDDFTYSFELDYLRENAPKEEFIDNHGVRIVPAEAYGLEIGRTYMLYLPGAEIDALPEEFVRWVAMPMGWPSDELPASLPFYGIYNVDGQYGFFGSKNENAETCRDQNDANLPIAFAGATLLVCGAVLFGKKRAHDMLKNFR